MSDTVQFSAPLLIWTNGAENSSVGYVIVPRPAADEIAGHELARRLELGKRRGFGSVRVTVRVGGSEWQTSVFPQKGGTWFLPVKVAVRRAEGLEEGGTVEAELELH
jgi:hypothetical protein